MTPRRRRTEADAEEGGEGGGITAGNREPLVNVADENDGKRLMGSSALGWENKSNRAAPARHRLTPSSASAPARKRKRKKHAAGDTKNRFYVLRVFH